MEYRDAEPEIRTGFDADRDVRTRLGAGDARVTKHVETVAETPKDVLRKFIPDFLLKQRSIVLRLGPGAGRIYASLRLLDVFGVRGANQRLVPPSARSFLFVCFGNIMRSAMAEFLMRQALHEAGVESRACITSAGLHATVGREAHPWAQEAAAGLGVSLTEHRAKPLTRDMVEQADCVFAMDFQNKAELLTLYPEAQERIFMLSAYAEGPWQYREIPDPYLGDLEITRVCCGQLRICIQNLVAKTILSVPSKEQSVAAR
jgi:protein-tyrosine phosphatase